MGGKRRACKLSIRKLGSLFGVCCVLYFIISFGFLNPEQNASETDKKCFGEQSVVRHQALGDDKMNDVSCQDAICRRVPSPELQSNFKSGTWNSLYNSPGYHKRYDVNCSGIIHNNQTIIRQAYEAIRREEVKVPCDEEVVNWTKDCPLYRRHRRYPLRALSVEESEYPLAYIIAGHKEAAQIERLLRVIYQPQNFYCIHIDTKSRSALHQAIRNLAACFDNVFVASKLENVQYAGFSRVQADINCMRDLVKHEWKYVINLCGQDFPLKTNLEIVRQMKAYNGLNDIPGIFPEQTQWFIGRTKFKHEVIRGEVIRTNIEKPDPPHNAKMYFGNAYYAATKEYVVHLLTDKKANDIIVYLKDSLSPDEHLWVTLNRYPGVPGGYPNSTWASNVRFIRWTNSDYYAPCVGKYVRAVCVIGAGYLPYLSSQPHIFVNKLYYSYDPITLQCLEEFLDYRTVFPESLSEYVQDYPSKNMFP
nr:N-acetyllactosaminide beta-1,6-N-acetylglucosaminyl-transferase-like [Lytechinus pictus]